MRYAVGMTIEPIIETETVEDIPLLLAEMQRLGIAAAVDELFPAHGNSKGLSPGLTLVVWLTHILSQGDHRLNYVRPWVREHRVTLEACLGEAIDELAFTDDRLALLLGKLSQGTGWALLEAQLSRTLLRVYDLRPRQVRLDSTTVSGYWEIKPEGLMQFGQSKDHRPDLPQVKVMLAVVDPLGMPVATQVVAGQRADDPLYVPAIQAVRASLMTSGLTYVGDVKMATLETRAVIAAGEDYYLTPLAKKHLPDNGLRRYLDPVLKQEQDLTLVMREGEDGQLTTIAEGYEVALEMCATVCDEPVTWTERRLIVRSLAQAAAEQDKLEERLQQAEARVRQFNTHKRGKKRYTEVAPLAEQVAQILARYDVTDLLTVTYQDGTVTTAQGTPKPMIHVMVTRNSTTIEQAQALLGWRVYVTNAPPELLSLEQAVLAYRQAYIVERGFGRLKHQPLSISPLYLAHPAHVTGLCHLLSLGLRVLTVVEFAVRRKLAAAQETLAGLNRGSPNRTTARPTTERLLQAFHGIYLSAIHIETHVHYHLTPLSSLQTRILELLDFAIDPYAAFTAALANLVQK